MDWCWDRVGARYGGGSTNGMMMSRIEENEMRSRSGCRTKI